jgi:hypothetical protein
MAQKASRREDSLFMPGEYNFVAARIRYTRRARLRSPMMLRIRLVSVLSLFALITVPAACRPRHVPFPEPLSPVAQGVDYFGTWAINDTENQLFNIVIRPDRTVLSNWAKGSRGAFGERGTWKRLGSRLVIEYRDGWTDVLMPGRSGVTRQSYRPGTTTDDPAASFGSAVRVKGLQARFCGVYEVDDGAGFLAMLSSGLAYRSPAPGRAGPMEIGTWELADGEAAIVWRDGQSEHLGWQRGVYVVQQGVGKHTQMVNPVDGLSFGGRLH